MGNTYRHHHHHLPNFQTRHLQVKRLRHLQIVSSTLVLIVLPRPLLYLVKVCQYLLEEGEEDDLVDRISLHLHFHLLHLIPDHVNSLNQIHHLLDVTTIRQSLNRRDTSSLMANRLLFAVGRRM